MPKPRSNFRNTGGKSPRPGLNVDDGDESVSSTEDELAEASVTPAPDADILYSYDAARGPAKGNEMLGVAVAKAVERHETKVTEKLVKDEYEVLDKSVEESVDGSTAVDDGFELV
jgi:hypothetical protein